MVDSKIFDRVILLCGFLVHRSVRNAHGIIAVCDPVALRVEGMTLDKLVPAIDLRKAFCGMPLLVAAFSIFFRLHKAVDI